MADPMYPMRSFSKLFYDRVKSDLSSAEKLQVVEELKKLEATKIDEIKKRVHQIISPSDYEAIISSTDGNFIIEILNNYQKSPVTVATLAAWLHTYEPEPPTTPVVVGASSCNKMPEVAEEDGGFSPDQVVVDLEGGADYIMPAPMPIGGAAPTMHGSESEQANIANKFGMVATNSKKLFDEAIDVVSKMSTGTFKESFKSFVSGVQNVFSIPSESIIGLLEYNIKQDEAGGTRSDFIQRIDTASRLGNDAKADTTNAKIRKLIDDATNELKVMKGLASKVAKISKDRVKSMVAKGTVPTEEFRHTRRLAANIGGKFDNVISEIEQFKIHITVIARSGYGKYSGYTEAEKIQHTQRVRDELQTHLDENKQYLLARGGINAKITKIVNRSMEQKGRILDFATTIEKALIELTPRLRNTKIDPKELYRSVVQDRTFDSPQAPSSVVDVAKLSVKFFKDFQSAVVIARGDFNDQDKYGALLNGANVTFEDNVPLDDRTGGQRGTAILVRGYETVAGVSELKYFLLPDADKWNIFTPSTADKTIINNGAIVPIPNEYDRSQSYFDDNKVLLSKLDDDFVQKDDTDPGDHIVLDIVTSNVLNTSLAKSIEDNSFKADELTAMLMPTVAPLEVIDAVFEHLGINFGPSPIDGAPLTFTGVVLQLYISLLTGGMYEFKPTGDRINVIAPISYQFSFNLMNDLLWETVSQMTMQNGKPQKSFLERTSRFSSPSSLSSGENTYRLPYSIIVVKDTIMSMFGVAWSIMERANISSRNERGAYYSHALKYMLSGAGTYGGFTEPPEMKPEFLEHYLSASATIRAATFAYLAEAKPVTDPNADRTMTKRLAAIRIPDSNPIKPILYPIISNLMNQTVRSIRSPNEITFTTDATNELIGFVNTVCEGVSKRDEQIKLVVGIICNAINELAVFGESVKYLGEFPTDSALNRNFSKLATYVPESDYDPAKDHTYTQSKMEIHDAFMTRVAIVIDELVGRALGGNRHERANMRKLQKDYEMYIRKHHKLVMDQDPISRPSLLRTIINGRSTFSQAEVSFVAMIVEFLSLTFKRLAFTTGLLSHMQNVISSTAYDGTKSHPTTFPMLITDPINTLRVERVDKPTGDEVKIRFDEIKDKIIKQRKRAIALCIKLRDFFRGAEYISDPDQVDKAFDTIIKNIDPVTVGGNDSLDIAPSYYDNPGLNLTGDVNLDSFYVAVMVPQTIRDKIVPNKFKLRPIIPSNTGDRLVLDYIKAAYTNTAQVSIGKVKVLTLDIPPEVHQLIYNTMCGIGGTPVSTETVDNIPLLLVHKQYMGVRSGRAAPLESITQADVVLLNEYNEYGRRMLQASGITMQDARKMFPLSEDLFTQELKVRNTERLMQYMEMVTSLTNLMDGDNEFVLSDFIKLNFTNVPAQNLESTMSVIRYFIDSDYRKSIHKIISEHISNYATPEEALIDDFDDLAETLERINVPGEVTIIAVAVERLKVDPNDPLNELPLTRDELDYLTTNRPQTDILAILQKYRSPTSDTHDTLQTLEGFMYPLPADEFWRDYQSFIYKNADVMTKLKLKAAMPTPDGTLQQLNVTVRYSALMQAYGHLGVTIAGLFPERTLYQTAPRVLMFAEEARNWAISKLRNEHALDSLRFMEHSPGAMDSYITNGKLDFESHGVLMSMADSFILGSSTDTKLLNRIASADPTTMFTRIYAYQQSGRGITAVEPDIRTFPHIRTILDDNPRFVLDAGMLQHIIRDSVQILAEGVMQMTLLGPSTIADITKSGFNQTWTGGVPPEIGGGFITSTYLVDSSRLMSTAYRGNPLSVMYGPNFINSNIPNMTRFIFDKSYGSNDNPFTWSMPTSRAHGFSTNDPTGLILFSNNAMFVSFSTLVGKIPFVYNKLYTKYAILSTQYARLSDRDSQEHRFFWLSEQVDDRLASVNNIGGMPIGPLNKAIYMMVTAFGDVFESLKDVTTRRRPNRKDALQLLRE